MRSAFLTILLTGIVLLSNLPHTQAAARGTPDLLEGGRLYREYCASCHGLDAKGDGPDAAIFAAQPRDLRTGFLNKYKTYELVQRVREGKPLELALDLPALRARAVEVEGLVAYLRRLPTIAWPAATHGEEIYLRRCVVCHGFYGRPGKTLPLGVRRPRDLGTPGFQDSVTNTQLTKMVRHGNKAMPALVPQVSAKDATVLATFVRLLSPGYELYSRYCVSCHGYDGQGAGSLAEEIQRPTVRFDRAYFAHHDDDQLRSSVWHMVATEKPAMPHYRALLSQEQARAIIEYLKHMP